MPTLIFSSETVLARQSMTRERAPSVDLSSDEEGSEEVDDEEDHDLGELLEGMNDDCDTSGIDDKATQIPPPGVSSSSSSFSSPLKPSPSDARLSFSRPRPAEWGLSSTTLRRLRNHIIICGPFAHGHQLAGYLDELYHIERPSGYESGTRHVRRPLILLLVKRLPSDQDLENMSPLLPPNVFVERGVSQSVEDLLRVRAHLAKAVLMIPGNWKYHVDELRDETMDEVTEHLLDYQVIVSTLSLRTVQELHHEHLQRSMGNSKSRMIVGASHEPTIACSVVKWHESLTYFALKSSSYSSRDSYETTRKDAQTVPVLPPKMGSRTQRIRHAMREATGRVLQSDPRQDLPLHFAPSYAAGEVFVDSALDTLLYQSFFNPYVIDLVRALAGDYYFGDHPSHATFASSMMEYFQPPRQSRASSSSAPRQTPSNTEPRKESPHDDNGQADAMIEHPVLAVASISEELEGKSFVTIFQHALRQQVLVLGIYRRANDSHRGNTVPYVYTCPKSHAGVTVEHGDVLHVVTRRIPPIVIHFQEGIASH